MSVIDRSQDARQSVGPIGKRRRLVVWTSRRGTHLGSGHVRPRQQTGHMIASDRIHTNKLLQPGGRPHMGPGSRPGRRRKSCARAPSRRRLRCPLWCACQEQEKQVPKKMFYLETPPRLIETKIFASMPENFRRKGVRTEWADANRPGHPTDCFIEGPSFDAEGNLYIVDIPFGRIFRIAPGGKWSLAAEYDGWPNGLKIGSDGRILVADYMHGIMELDVPKRRVQPVLTARHSESFRGCNDLHIASNGDIYFTDQGQTGLHDPTGRVYRLSSGGRVDCRIDTGVSSYFLDPAPTESVLFVAMTRDNAVWRAPIMKEGSVSKVGRFCSTFGPSGPDGLTMDHAGRLFVAHASLGHVFVFAPNGELIARIKSCAGPSCTNVAIGGKNRDRLYITESATGTVLVADISSL